jgi:hypothetical protein
MISAIMMLRRLLGALRVASREEDFARILIALNSALSATPSQKKSRPSAVRGISVSESGQDGRTGGATHGEAFASPFDQLDGCSNRHGERRRRDGTPYYRTGVCRCQESHALPRIQPERHAGHQQVLVLDRVGIASERRERHDRRLTVLARPQPCLESAHG